MRDGTNPFSIGIEHTPDAGWTGGGIFFSNLRAALLQFDSSHRPRVVSVTRDDPHASGDRLYVPPDSPKLVWQAVRKATAQLGRFAPPPRILMALRRAGVQALFTDATYTNRYGLPIVSWIPDFQHLHLPEFTPPAHARQIVAYHRRLIAQSTRLMVSSQDALKDLTAFDPVAATRADVVSFAANVPADTFDVDPIYVCKKYSVPERYVALPNQFWKHKNHQLVIKAVRLLRDRGVDLTVVCTGNTSDFRNPTYFPNLLAEVAIAGVHNQFRLLGLVPRQDVFQLQRQSLAVLQPSLFEGWSTSIEEAKSLGKRVVASDLSVHREQVPQASFFFRNDAEDLARCLVDLAQNAASGPDLDSESAARTELPGRAEAFACAFVEMMRKAANV